MTEPPLIEWTAYSWRRAVMRGVTEEQAEEVVKFGLEVEHRVSESGEIHAVYVLSFKVARPNGSSGSRVLHVVGTWPRIPGPVQIVTVHWPDQSDEFLPPRYVKRRKRP